MFFALESSQDDGEDEVRLPEGSLNSMRCHESDEICQSLASAKLICDLVLLCSCLCLILMMLLLG